MAKTNKDFGFNTPIIVFNMVKFLVITINLLKLMYLEK